jgi:hypothetical protein
MQERGLSERQACRTVNLHRCTYRYQAKKTDDHEIVQELQQLVESQPRWGCRKMTDYLRNQGHRWNHKRIRRGYRDLALNLHRKPKKRLAARTALALGVPVQYDLTWSLDFMSDSLSTGRAIRTLNIIDDYNREALWIEVDVLVKLMRHPGSGGFSITPRGQHSPQEIHYTRTQLRRLNALACAAVARRIHAGTAEPFPNPPPRDAFGLAMAIWA